MPPEDEPGKWFAAIQALLILAIIAGLIFFTSGVSLRAASSSTKQVVMLSAPITIPQPPVEAKPEPKPEPKPKPVKKKKEKPKVEQPPKEADIAREKEKEEEKKRQEEERKKKQEQQKREQERAEAQRKKEEEKKRQEEERQRIEQARQQQIIAQRNARTAENYAARIGAAIQRHLTTPQGVPDDIEVVVRLYLNEQGGLQKDPVIMKSSGHEEYDTAAIRAVIFALPLPIPTGQPAVFQLLSPLDLRIHPE